MSYKIGFIGTGKAAFSLGKHISLFGCGEYVVSGYLGRNPASAEEAAAFAGGKAFADAREIFEASDLVFLAVPDGSIAPVWESVADTAASTGKIVAHLSGMHSSLIFEGAKDGRAGSLHPILAIFDKTTAYKSLEKAYFTIEGGAPFIDFASGLLKKTGNGFAEIAADKKTLYHAASSTVSNLVCALAYAGKSLYEACELPSDFSDNAWRLLFLENAKNVDKLGPVSALTGPLERADAGTIEAHLRALSAYDSKYGDAYRALSLVLLDTAREKHPDRDYSAVEEELKK